MTIQSFLSQIKKPDPIFAPMPFWFLNDNLDEERLEKQLRDFKSKGVDGAVLHPRIGIPVSIPYLSDRYFHFIKFIVQKAADLDMYIILYDEGMYPSGSAHGKVVDSNPEFASKGLRLATSASEGRLVTALDDGRYLVEDFTGGTIRGIHFGEDDGEPGAPASADLLNPQAMKLFIQYTHEAHYQVLSEYFGNTIIAFFTDEPCIMGRNVRGFIPWTTGLEDELMEAGVSIKALADIFERKTNPDVEKYRYIVRQKLNDSYYQPISRWCADHNIALIGHPETSDDIDELRYFQIPGQDLIMRRVAPENKGLYGIDSVQAKCSADAARHMGRSRNANEFLGVCAREDHPWYLPAEDMKWFIDWLAIRGVNFFIPHAFYYSVDGERKNERPPDVGPNNIYWPHYKQFSDYMKRFSYLMTDAKNHAQVAVLCESQDMPHSELAPFFENQVEFNYLPRYLLDKSRITENKIAIRDYEYSYYLSSKDESIPVQRISNVEEVKNRDFIPDKQYDTLRMSHLSKEGIEYFIFTNEGEDAIRVSAKLPTCMAESGVFYDLWTGRLIQSKNFSAEIYDGILEIHFVLDRRKSLLFLPMSVVDMQNLLTSNKQDIFAVDTFAKRDIVFEEIDSDNPSSYKVYQAIIDNPQENILFEVKGEEMIELFCNGEFVAVSFWNPHKFTITRDLLVAEKNILELRVHGSIALQYADVSIPYGLQ